MERFTPQLLIDLYLLLSDEDKSFFFGLLGVAEGTARPNNRSYCRQMLVSPNKRCYCRIKRYGGRLGHRRLLQETARRSTTSPLPRRMSACAAKGANRGRRACRRALPGPKVGVLCPKCRNALPDCQGKLSAGFQSSKRGHADAAAARPFSLTGTAVAATINFWCGSAMIGWATTQGEVER
jgi:hypothetical protein